MRHIKPKAFYVQRWILTYLTRYPGRTIEELKHTQSQYTDEEIMNALSAMMGITVRRDGLKYYATLRMLAQV